MLCFGRTERASSTSSESMDSPTAAAPAPEAMQPPLEAKLTGYLDKRGRRLPTWRRYWFVLDGPLLLYFRSEMDYKQLSPCKGSFNLGLVMSVRPSSSNTTLTLTTRSQNFNLRAENREEQQRWLQGLLDSIQQFSRVSAPQQTANRRYEDACMPPVAEKLSTAERVRRMGGQGGQGGVAADTVLEASRRLKPALKKEQTTKEDSNRVSEITAKLPTNTAVLKMLERQRKDEKEGNSLQENLDEKGGAEAELVEKVEERLAEVEEVVAEVPKLETCLYSQVNKPKGERAKSVLEKNQQVEKKQDEGEKKAASLDKSKVINLEKYATYDKKKDVTFETKKKDSYQEINKVSTLDKKKQSTLEKEASPDLKPQNSTAEKKDSSLEKKKESPTENVPAVEKDEEKSSSKEVDEDSEGDYEQITMIEGEYDQIKVTKNDDDEDVDYEELEGAASSVGEAFRATPVVVLDADEEVDYAEAAEVCLSMGWDEPKPPPLPIYPLHMEESLRKREPNCTVISLMVPEDDLPPPRRPHSADELEALLGDKAPVGTVTSPSLEGLFRATPVRLQKAQKAAHAWAQDLPDLVPLQPSEEEEEEEEMSLEDAMQFIKKGSTRQAPRVPSTNEGLHQAVAVKVAPVGPLEGPVKSEKASPLSFALTDVELTLEETVNTMRSPFTSLAID